MRTETRTFLAVAVCLLLGWFLGHSGVTKKREQVIEIRRDTVTVYDTVLHTEFVEVSRKVVDTMWVAVSGRLTDEAGKLPANKNELTDNELPDEGISLANKNGLGAQLESRNDSLLVAIPREEVIVKDSTFIAQISGYEPRLDWIDIIIPSRTITVEKVAQTGQSRWGLGVTAGAGMVYNENGIHTGVGVMAGVQYRFGFGKNTYLRRYEKERRKNKDDR